MQVYLYFVDKRVISEHMAYCEHYATVNASFHNFRTVLFCHLPHWANMQKNVSIGVWWYQHKNLLHQDRIILQPWVSPKGYDSPFWPVQLQDPREKGRNCTKRPNYENWGLVDIEVMKLLSVEYCSIHLMKSVRGTDKYGICKLVPLYYGFPICKKYNMTLT